MKVRMAVLSSVAILLSACATTSEQASYAPQSQRSYPQTRLVTDDAYMARVEYMATRRGVHLTWVNPPRKIVVKDD